MSSNELQYDNTTMVRDVEAKEEDEQTRETRDKCRKLWKTLDAALADRDDNLYVAVRQSLHKVNQLSRGERPSLKSSEAGGKGGVSQESSMGRFSTIKAFFDQNVGQEGGSPYRCRSGTIMGKLMRVLELRKRETSSIIETSFFAVDSVSLFNLKFNLWRGLVFAKSEEYLGSHSIP
ncbi:unnamed protein product [Heterotrigona itama]|uniref:Uncharacterized protein n=1 Tax=Heterotrigona itama TaxID=395501 RepID=A0A6V7HHZ8_9HYME|nr:unnamed protein product [Heterotrigona itama]